MYIQHALYSQYYIPIVCTSKPMFHRLCDQITIQKKNMSIDCGPRAPNHEHVSYYVLLSVLLPFQMNTFCETLCISSGSTSNTALNEIRSAFIKGISAKGTWLASLTYSASLGGNLIFLVKRSQFSDKKPMPSQA